MLFFSVLISSRYLTTSFYWHFSLYSSFIGNETRGTLPGAPPFFSVDLQHGHGHSHYVSLFWCQPLLESKVEGYITDECYPATEEEEKHPEI